MASAIGYWRDSLEDIACVDKWAGGGDTQIRCESAGERLKAHVKRDNI